MVVYCAEQIEILKQLRKRFLEQGFMIFNLKKRHRKHEEEFIIARPENGPFDSGVVRLYRGRVRIQFFEFESPLPRGMARYVTMRYKQYVVFATKPLNPTHKGNKHYWHAFAYRRELMEQDPVRILARGGVSIRRGIGAR